VAELEVTLEKLPQEPEGAQEKVTPALAESFKTLAVMLAVAPRPIEAGGGVEKETEMEGGGGGLLPLLPPPHAIRVKDRQAKMNRGASCRFIASPSQKRVFGDPGGQDKDSELYQNFTEA